MERKLLLLILISFIGVYPQTIFAEDPDSSEFTLILDKTQIDDQHKPDNSGRRLPSRSVTCIISKTSGIISSISPQDILLYEVTDLMSDEVISFSDEESFISFIFEYSGLCSISFLTEHYKYIGTTNL